jgi:hypothetical protein
VIVFFCASAFLVNFGCDAAKCIQELWVEMNTSPLAEDLQCFLKPEWIFIWPFRGERVEDIRNRKDSRHQRNIIRPSPLRVAATSKFFMMCCDHWDGISKPSGAAHDVNPHPDMGLHDPVFLLVERPRFMQLGKDNGCELTKALRDSIIGSSGADASATIVPERS